MPSSQVAAALMAETTSITSTSAPSPDLSLHIGPPRTSASTSVPPAAAAAPSSFNLPVEFHPGWPLINGTPVHLPPLSGYQLTPPPPPRTWLVDHQYSLSCAAHRYLPFRGGGGRSPLEAAAALHAVMARSSRLMVAPRCPASAPTKRSSRAPRMRWTSSLHARFVHAVDLLGGHERATPKSILELMDVKDLTLAHVKSHLQMYRTIKSTDKPAVSSDGSVEEDLAAEHQHKQQEPLFSSSSSSRKLSRIWMQINEEALRSTSFPSQIEETNGRSRRSSDEDDDDDVKIPSLEFTLGRPDWSINNN